MQGRTPAASAGPPTTTVRVDRRRAAVAVLSCVLLAAACGSGPAAGTRPVTSATAGTAARAPTQPSSSATPTALAGVATTGSTDRGTRAACDRVERPRLQAGSHLIAGHEPPVPYSSRPPTSGWHASGEVGIGVRDDRDPLTEPEQVSVLEAGGVVIAHGTLAEERAAALTDHVRERYDGSVAVTPYRPLRDGQVAFTAWGVLQRCEGLDLAALDAFVQRFGAADAVEPGH